MKNIKHFLSFLALCGFMLLFCASGTEKPLVTANDDPGVAMDDRNGTDPNTVDSYETDPGNVTVQPDWGPEGYDSANFYYIPDIESYYDVPQQQFVYYNDGQWITSPNLPPLYVNFDLYLAHKVVLNEPTPWFHHDIYRGRYEHFRGLHDQALLRESRGLRAASRAARMARGAAKAARVARGAARAAKIARGAARAAKVAKGLKVLKALKR